jgi:hypothetical protein
LETAEIIQISVLVAIMVDVVLFALLYVANRARKLGGVPAPLRAVIAEEDRYPSLARFQLLIWTFVAIFAFLSVSITRMLSGVLLSVTLPANILTLIGINAGSPVISAGISRVKYKLTEEQYKNKDGAEAYAPLSAMLDENDTFSVTRFQMLAWTFVSVIIFLAALMGTLANLPANLSTLNLPDVSTTLVTLSGISQGTYLTGKGVST